MILTGEPAADVNLVMVDDGLDSEGQLLEYGEVLARRALPALVFLSDRIADRLAGPAAALGLQPAGRVPLMVYHPTAVEVVPPGTDRFRIEVVTSAATLRRVNELSVATFGFGPEVVERVFTPSMLDTPGVTFFLGWEGEEPVSTVMTQRVGATVGVWSMATRPDRQRQGAGRAVLRHAVAHNRAQGAELFYLLATEAGKPLYKATGFSTLAEPAVWVRGHSVQVPVP